MNSGSQCPRSIPYLELGQIHAHFEIKENYAELPQILVARRFKYSNVKVCYCPVKEFNQKWLGLQY